MEKDKEINEGYIWNKKQQQKVFKAKHKLNNGSAGFHRLESGGVNIQPHTWAGKSPGNFFYNRH
jgi:hypothetical protein